MKAINTLKVCLIASSFVLLSTADDSKQHLDQSVDGVLLTCMTMPWCSGTDTFSPVTQPKDVKTETQDAKDEKVA